jgi:hypothetical protein
MVGAYHVREPIFRTSVTRSLLLARQRCSCLARGLVLMGIEHQVLVQVSNQHALVASLGGTVHLVERPRR